MEVLVKVIIQYNTIVYIFLNKLVCILDIELVGNHIKNGKKGKRTVENRQNQKMDRFVNNYINKKGFDDEYLKT